ncbi:MAG TPA: hypothetical protein EYG50_10565 [Cycloclasticus sp.]|jgi:uncharacterized protein YceK|nr:hypothetical protein [Cycloclasticus sp.]HIL93159.1 hypothetical protein [Cycloclasticus sp.]
MRNAISLFVVFACLFALSGCASLKNEKPLEPIESFQVCYSYGCANVQTVTLNKEQWLLIQQAFSPKATNAKTERQQIAEAIAQMEQFVGIKTNTTNDLPGTFAALFHDLEDQMDCVDEATNTTVYLKQFRQRGFINFHKEGHRINRGFFFNGWPHTSAMMKDTHTGELYAVDSWFHKNGIQPEIIPAKLWYSGWHPDKRN